MSRTAGRSWRDPLGARVVALGMGLGLGLTLIVPPARAAPPDESAPAASTDEGPADGTATGEPEEGPPPPETFEEADPNWEAPAEDAPAPERAKAWFLRANELRQAGRFVEAAEAFERSYAAVATSDAAALFNAGVAWEYADRPLEALDTFERFVAAIGEQTPDVEAAREKIARLQQRVARVDVRLDEGARARRITLDGREVDPEALPVRVVAGEVTLEVELESGETLERDLDLDGGTTTVVDLGGVPEPEPGPEPGPAEPPPGPEPGPAPGGDGGPGSEAPRQGVLRPLFWSGLGLTIASAATTATLGGLTLRERRAYEDGLCETPCPEGSTYPEDHERRFMVFRTSTNAMIAVTAGLAVTTTVLGAIAFSGPRRRKVGRNAQVRLSAGQLLLAF